MKGFKSFLKDNQHAMTDYLREVSTPSPEPFRNAGPFGSTSGDHSRIHVMNALRERKSVTPTLHREALLFLPYLQDIPKHLAILTSSVVRNVRLQRIKVLKEQNEHLYAFTRSCLEVENLALRCVNQLRPRSLALRPFSVSHINTQQPIQPGEPSPIKFADPAKIGEPIKRMTRKRLNTKVARPSTAPSTPDMDGSWRAPWTGKLDDKFLPSSPTDSQPRSSSGSASGQTHSTHRPSDARRSSSLDKTGAVDENRAPDNQTGSIRNTSEEGRSRRFFRNFLPRR
jgi:hypothetical protein